MSTATDLFDEISDATTCVHCGLESEVGVRDSQEQFYCCRGCLTAHHLLDDLGEEACSLPSMSSRRTYEEMDDPAFAQRYVRRLDQQTRQVTFVSEDFQCSSCLAVVERLPRFLKGVLSARVHLAHGTATISWLEDVVKLSEIARKLDDLGFRPWPYEMDQQAIDARTRSRHEMIQLAIAGVCAGNTMLIAIALYAGLFSGMEASHLALIRYVSAFLGLVSVIGPGRIFFQNAWRAMRYRTPHMDLPVALGIGIGTIDGVYRVISQTGEVYFDSIASLVFLLLTGRFLQAQQKRRTLERVSMLRSLTPRVARVVHAGLTRLVPVEALKVGDVIEVHPGETFPADGQISLGRTLVDQSLLTGESNPVSLGVGDEMISGTMNLGSVVTAKVMLVGRETRLGKLLSLMDDAVVSKSSLVQFSDRIGGWFVMTVLVLAAVNMVLWSSSGVGRAIEQTVALLIVACPCALGLATPLVMAVFQGRAAKRGILIKSGEAVERLAGRGTVWFDKTGTVTTGQMTLIKWLGDEQSRGVVLAVECQIQHPIAKAMVNALSAYQDVGCRHCVEDMSVTQGLGVRAVVDGRDYEIGSRHWMHELGVSLPDGVEREFMESARLGRTSFFVSSNREYVAMAVLGDHLREGTRELVSHLEDRGWMVGMLSGDDGQVVDHVCSELGIEESMRRGGSSPEQKLETVRQHESTGSVVMVGDGVNDSAALMAADVGIAVQGGAEASMHAADIYISRGDVTRLSEFMTDCRRIMSRIYLNFGLSISYNIFAVTLSMLGYIHPIVAAILMPISSLTVLSVAMSPGMMSVKENSQ